MPDPDLLPSGPRTVVVTGASTGIGAACVRRLDAIGFRVFAGVRRAEDGEALRAGASPRLTPLLLDVTDPAAVGTALHTVREAIGEEGLDGLVNNAGIAVTGPVELVALADLRRAFEVNLIGAVAVTQAFLPMVRARRGRIVMVGSMSGRYAAPLHGPYAASKFALEGLTDSLRREVRRWHVRVALVDPGPVATPIWEKGRASAAQAIAQYPPAAAELYADAWKAAKRDVERNLKIAVPPERVAEAIERALTAKRPKTRYFVGKGMRLAALVIRLAPDRLLDRMARRSEDAG